MENVIPIYAVMGTLMQLAENVKKWDNDACNTKTD
jgi:hypothetical protein